MKVIIPIKLDNLNDLIGKCRGNKYGANTHKKAEMRAIALYLNKIPKIEKYPVRMSFTWHLKGNADLDNCIEKNILDCLQNIGKLENDNAKHINEINHIAVIDKKEYVEMGIEYNGL